MELCSSTALNPISSTFFSVDSASLGIPRKLYGAMIPIGTPP
ncbi:MAG TPA: hypothetical protein VGH38_30860 [Bryobacteraceae bacterium]